MACQTAAGVASEVDIEERHRLPSFFVIGPPRTGTTWLQDVLRQGAWLADPVKETRFFDRHFHRGVDWYRAHFHNLAGGRPIGEIAPTYFSSVQARERIARLIPRAKVVCTFRNPVDRVVSLYRLKRAYGLIPWNFDEALACDPELMESSRYSSHLQAWRQTMGEDQVLACVYEDLRHDPQTFIDQVADFVGVRRFILGPRQLRYVLTSETMTQPRNYYLTRGAALLSEWSRARRMGSMVAAVKRIGVHKLFLGGGMKFPELTREQTMNLYHLFLPEVEKLEGLLHRDLSSWKRPAPEKSAASKMPEPHAAPAA